jgi:hypothetical protein
MPHIVDLYEDHLQMAAPPGSRRRDGQKEELFEWLRTMSFASVSFCALRLPEAAEALAARASAVKIDLQRKKRPKSSSTCYWTVATKESNGL